MVPTFLTLFVAEEIVTYFKYGRRKSRTNDMFTSVALGMIMETVK